MPFADYTTEVSSDDFVLSQFFGPKRLEAINGVGYTQRDIPHKATPIDGTGSLLMQGISVNTRGHLYKSAASQRGRLTGALTSRFYQNFTDSPVFAFGFYCYASSLSLLTTNNVYLLGAFGAVDPGPPTFGMFLGKSAFGINGLQGGMTTLAITGSAVWAAQTTFIMRLSWHTMANGHVKLQGKYGVNTDLSDLTTKVSYEDATPFLATVGEGIWGKNSASSTSLKVLVDETEFYDGYKF